MVPIVCCSGVGKGRCKHINEQRWNLLKKLGPGFVTGASDDDPSGLATYAQAGTQLGTSILWLAPWTIPLMVAVQEMSARIGLMTAGGLAKAFLTKLPKLLVYFMVSALVIANTINIGADIAGMAESVCMITPFSFGAAAFILTGGMLWLQIYLPYKKYVSILKWCAVTLLSYLVAAAVINMQWSSLIWPTLVPQINWQSSDFWYMVMAILGTTISPYLLFWQASEELENKRVRDAQQERVEYVISDCEIMIMRKETIFGMVFSNIIMFFVIAVSAIVLHSSSNLKIDSMVEAAQALEPLAGSFASWLFAAGIIGTGLLTVPVLAGSSAYAVADLFGWSQGLYRPWHEARKFYLVIAGSTVIGLALNLMQINAVDFLIWSAVINSLVTPIMLVGMIFVANDGALVGNYKNSRLAQVGAWLTVIVFVGSIVAYGVTRYW